MSRFAVGQTTAVPVPLADSPSALASFEPRFGTAPDGSLLAAWVQFGVNTISVVGAPVTPDGAVGPASSASTEAFGLGLIGYPHAIPQVDGHGGAIMGVSRFSLVGDAANWGFDTFRLDVVGPTVTVDVPAAATVLTPVRFTGAIADPATAPLTWDFGDGATAQGLSVSHVYAGAGTYAVTASATDGASNETVVARSITVTLAQAADAGAGAGVTPPVVPAVVTPPRIVPAATAAAATAALKVAKAIRKGAKVTVSGTISTRAKGKVTIAFAQKVGHKTINLKKTATVAKGRWSTTLTLPRSLTRGSAAHGKATVTVTFAGTAAVKRATAKHSVAITKGSRSS